jgi:hypothetical protein
MSVTNSPFIKAPPHLFGVGRTSEGSCGGSSLTRPSVNTYCRYTIVPYTVGVPRSCPPRASLFKSQTCSEAVLNISSPISPWNLPTPFPSRLDLGRREAFQLLTKVRPRSGTADHHLININRRTAVLKGMLIRVFFLSDHYLNAHQCHGCDHQWTHKTRGRRSAVGEVRAMCIGCLLASDCGRLVADALKESVGELRKDEEKSVSQYAHTVLSRGARH